MMITTRCHIKIKSIENTNFNCLIDRDQLTTTEVNMARVYNWDVKRRQAEAATKK